MSDSPGNAEMVRTIAEQVAKAAVIEVRKAEADENVKITPAVKWVFGIVGSLLVLFCAWSVKTLNEVQLSVAEIRMQLGQSGAIEARFSDINRRVEQLERSQGRSKP